MKICYLGYNGQLHIIRWMKAFVEMGHEVHFINAFPEVDNDTFKCDGVIVHSVIGKTDWWRRIKGFRKISRSIIPQENVISLQVKRIIEELKPDILHAHYIFPFGVLAYNTGYHPFVMTCWGSDVYRIRDQKHVEIAIGTLHSADLITGDSTDVMLAIQKLGVDGNKCIEINWGVDTHEFTPGDRNLLLKELGWEESEVILSTRRLRSLYNIDILIDAIPEVIAKIPTARFIIASYGEDQKTLEAKVKSMGISEYVRFLGKVDYKTLKRCYQSASMYISIPSSDATSVSLLEAMSTGVPVIVSDLPSNREWVEDGINGFVIPVRDSITLSKKIIELLQHPEVMKEIGRKNRDIVKKRAEHHVQMNKMEKVLLKLTKK